MESVESSGLTVVAIAVVLVHLGLLQLRAFLVLEPLSTSPARRKFELAGSLVVLLQQEPTYCQCFLQATPCQSTKYLLKFWDSANPSFVVAVTLESKVVERPEDLFFLLSLLGGFVLCSRTLRPLP